MIFITYYNGIVTDVAKVKTGDNLQISLRKISLYVILTKEFRGNEVLP